MPWLTLSSRNVRGKTVRIRPARKRSGDQVQTLFVEIGLRGRLKKTTTLWLRLNPSRGPSLLQLQVLLHQQVVLLAEQLDLLCETGLSGASRCRHETVDTVLQ